MPEITIPEWDAFLDGIPDAHLLQTSNWGEFKSKFGWDVTRIIANNVSDQCAVGVQILFRRLPFGYSIAYIPKGPVCLGLDSVACLELDAFQSEIDSVCKKHRSIFLMVEPDSWQEEANNLPKDSQQIRSIPAGFGWAEGSIQPARTLLVDICSSEDVVLGRMKQKTRYNIRLAARRGVIVRPSSNLDEFHKMMIVTGDRDTFGIHSLEYYQKVYDLFNPLGECEIFMAEYESKAIAALMVFARGKRAWYFYGASDNKHREKMAPHLLQWTAIKWARSKGCTVYDMWGVPDEDEDILESVFMSKSGGLWGVYRFKRGFGGRLRRSQGPWDRVYQPVMYSIYKLWTSRNLKRP